MHSRVYWLRRHDPPLCLSLNVAISRNNWSADLSGLSVCVVCQRAERYGGANPFHDLKVNTANVNVHSQGMVMVSPEMNPTICWMFEAAIVLLFHAKTFHKGFQVTVHIGNVRQTATVEAVHGKVGSFTELQLLLSNCCHPPLKAGVVMAQSIVWSSSDYGEFNGC